MEIINDKNYKDYNNYFRNRGIDVDKYKNFKLPLYLDGYLSNNKSIKILDIGCGLGQTLEALKNQGYKNLEGIDISNEAVKICKEKGLKVSLKTIDDLEGKYDFIFLNHVLEHIEKKKVINILNKIKTFLSESGILYITVPNAQSNTGSYWAYEDFTHHTLYTSGSITFVLKSAGFDDIKFVDVDCLEEVKNPIKRFVKKKLLKIYRANNKLWNRVTSSSYHNESQIINSYELKMIVKNNH